MILKYVLNDPTVTWILQVRRLNCFIKPKLINAYKETLNSFYYWSSLADTVCWHQILNLLVPVHIVYIMNGINEAKTH